MWGLGALAVFLILCWQLQRLATLVFLTFIVAYILNPLVTRLARLRFLNRLSATALVFVGLGLVLAAILFFIVPDVIAEFGSFIKRLPELTDKLEATAIPWVEDNFQVTVPRTWSAVLDQAKASVDQQGRVSSPRPPSSRRRCSAPRSRRCSRSSAS